MPGFAISPPGAVGGRYGSGCFQFSKSFSVSLIRSCSVSAMLLCTPLAHMLYPLPARLRHVLIGIEQRADVHSLTPPEVSVDGPVEGELERAAVKPPSRC